MSEIKVNSVVNSTGDNDSGLDLATNDVVAVKTANTERMRIDASGRVGIGTASPDTQFVVANGSDTAKINLDSDSIDFFTQGKTFNLGTTDNTVARFFQNNSERMRVDSSGNLLVGKTSQDQTAVGAEFRSNGIGAFTGDGTSPFRVNRKTDDGTLITLLKDSTARGRIGLNNNDPFIARASGNGMRWFSGGLHPCDENGATADNAVDLGNSSGRFDDVFATNGTIQTSDQQEKNTITDSDLGLDFVNRLTPKSYIFNGKTRTHYGLIAQDVETVLSDISKETTEFAGFIKEDISEGQDGSQYRYGLRYTEFVGILIKALQEADDKIDALTARVTALEGE